tara:strand:+ start:267 stop:1856 length:1590 start_codon:yes stop_codon:yes gene_type:complete
MAELFGFEIKRRKDNKEGNIPSFVPPSQDDGAMNIAATGTAASSFLDMDGTARSEAELVQKYRSMLQQPEVSQAVDDIVNEAISIASDDKVVECITDDIDLADNIKKRIREEFDNVIKLLDFSSTGYDTFQKWYVDGRINYHVMIDVTSPKKGIQELRYIDPRKIRKVKEFEENKDKRSNPVAKVIKNEYFIYNEKGFSALTSSYGKSGVSDSALNGLKIAKDSIVNCTSGLLNENNSLIISHLHKAYKPLNQLRMMEDAVVIYRISRAPERRIFYIDVGNLPKIKAEQYLRDMMTKHKNRLVYDASSGDVKDGRRHMSMTDDFWLPRREGGKGTEITTLPGGQNLGELDDVLYFQKRLFKSLNVPMSRMESDTGFTLGRATEISRDEIKFSKFIARLRSKFSNLFDKLLEKQLVLKGIITPEEWPEIQSSIRYDYMSDNYFEELKESEVLRERLGLLRDIDDYVGKYYSADWVRKNVLMMNEDEIEDMRDQIEQDDADAEDAEDAEDVEGSDAGDEENAEGPIDEPEI